MERVTTDAYVGPPPRAVWSFEAFREQGLLWLVNRVVFHPRGFALAFEYNSESAEPVGWSLQGDGSEVWQYSADEDHMLSLVKALFADARTNHAAVDG